ncbi:three component ABC system middle component [Dyadobacter crusticola]
MLSCLKKAGTMGKIFSKSGSPITIYSIFGIKP